MRLWHKKLIQVLPRQQLVSQYRECILISNNILKLGKPNHILVNPIVDYSIDHFYTYCLHVLRTMEHRGYNITDASRNKLFGNINTINGHKECNFIWFDELYQGWHSTRYLLQCLLNLEEKYDRGGISFEEWYKVMNKMQNEDNYCKETYESLFV